MSVLASDVYLYGSNFMRDNVQTDTGTQGGAIDKTKRVELVDIGANGTVQVVADAAEPDGTTAVDVQGRNVGGALVTDSIDVNVAAGTPTVGAVTFERLVKAVVTGTRGTGTIAVEASTATNTGTAQGGAAATASAMANIQLASGAITTDGEFDGQIVRITGATGANQIRQVITSTAATDTVEVSADWATVPDATSTYRVSEGFYFDGTSATAKEPNLVSEVRRIFHNAEADAAGGAARDFYDKGHFSNEHATLTYQGVDVIEQADPSGNIAFGFENAADDTSTNPRTAPAGVTFDSALKAFGDLVAGAEIGTWFNLTLPAGEPAANTSYTLRTDGSST